MPRRQATLLYIWDSKLLLPYLMTLANRWNFATLCCRWIMSNSVQVSEINRSDIMFLVVMRFVEAWLDYTFQNPPPDEIHESIGLGCDPMFTSEELASCRSEDGSWNFKIKLVASMFADEVSFSPSINFKLTLQDLNTRITTKFSGSQEINEQLKEQTNNLKNSLSAHISKIHAVFEAGGTTNTHSVAFDGEGDDDILKINFGGRNVDIKRSDLTKPMIGWNLFSCWFEKTWDRFHLRDRTGRIYVDFKEKTVRPLIDYLKYNKSPNNPVKSVDTFLRNIMETYSLDDKFMLYDLVPSIPWVGLESSQLFGEMEMVGSNAKYRYRRASVGLFSCIPTYFKSVYSNSKAIAHLSLNTDIRFKPIFCLWKATDGKLFVIFLTWTQRPSARYSHSVGIEISSSTEFDINKHEKQVSILSDLFPIQFKFNEIEYSINHPPVENEILELYEVHSSMYSDAIPKSPLIIAEPSPPENRVICSNPSPLMKKLGEWYSAGNQIEQQICSIETQLKKESQRFEEEVDFMAAYFHSCWKIKKPDDANNEDLLKEVVSCRDAFGEQQTNIKKKKRKLCNDLEEHNSQNSLLDPIVYFSVEGEILTILRSTILRVIPNSQLAVRVSGRWTEQPSKGDIDEEGNLIVNCHKESFKQILSALQICLSAADLLIVYVNPLCKDNIEETLDYLQIVPDLVTTIEKPF
jgi:hypothetical protein